MAHDAAGAAALPLWKTMVAAAATGVVPRLLLHPLDTCKARLQASSQSAVTVQYDGLLDVVARIWRAEGLRGFYGGVGMSIVGAIPSMCLYLTAFEILRFAFDGWGALGGSLAAGFLAEALSCLLWVPVDVVKERLQVQTATATAGYRGSWHAVCTILRFEGVAGLYKGYGSTLLSWGPFSAIFFAVYELSRSADPNLPFAEFLLMHALAAAAAGAVAAFLTNPLDLVKLRLQIDRRRIGLTELAEDYTYDYAGFGSALSRVAREEGASGLWKGAGSRTLYFALFSALNFALYEAVKRRLADPSPS